MRQWMMSFVDPSIPEADPPQPGGPSWLGGCVVEAANEIAAIQRSWAIGANPGGEVLMVPLEDGSIDAEWMDRLLTYEEVVSIPAPKGWTV